MEPCNLIYLAAGFSRRYGGNKLLEEQRQGKPLFRHTLDRLILLRQEEPNLTLTVVTQYREIAAYCEAHGVRWTENTAPERGISSSMQLGLREVEANGHPAVFFVADQPNLQRKTIRSFLTGWQESGKGLACVAWNGTWGNPCGFVPCYFPELHEITGDKGGKQVLRRHPEDVFCCPAEREEELEDIDLLSLERESRQRELP